MPELNTPARIIPIFFLSTIGKKSFRALSCSNSEYLPANTIQSKSPSLANFAHISASFSPTPIAFITFSSFSFRIAL